MKNKYIPLVSKVISFSYLIISIFLILFLINKSESSLINNEILYRYYLLIFITFFLFSLFSFFIKNKLNINFFLSFLSIIFTIYIIEIILVIKNTNKNNIIFLNNKKITKHEYYLKEKQRDKNIKISITPSMMLNANGDIVPLAGLPNAVTIFCSEQNYFATYQSDRHGFNNPDLEWDKSIVEYVLIGDSFVHGACVDEEHTITGNLRKINKINYHKGILNLGMAGNGPLLEYATIKEYIPEMISEKVIWFYYEGNDFTDYYAQINPILVKYFKNNNYTQDIKIKQKEVNKIINSKIEYYEKYGDNKNIIKNILKLTNLRFFFNLIIVNKNPPINEFVEIISLTKNYLIKKDSKFYFVYLPSYQNNNNYNYELIISKIKELDIQIIDFSKIQLDDKNIQDFFITKQSHLSKEGYKFIAQCLYNLTKND